MKAPDKICIFPDDNDEFWYKPEEWKTTPPKRVEYLRKDALLEWAKKRKAGLSSGESFVAGERKMLKEIIDKIESL